jgi:hypothetical protein
MLTEYLLLKDCLHRVKVFKILYLAIRDNKDTDTILMSYDIVDQDVVKISRTTYFKGMKELADKVYCRDHDTELLLY